MIARYLRAFVQAWRGAVRREAPGIAALRSTQPELAEWCASVVSACDALLAAATAAQVDPDATIVRAEGRDHTMALIVKGIRFHAAEEYPFIVRGGDRHAALALQASNLNDRFLLTRLREKSPVLLQVPLTALSTSLDSMPPLRL
ncbi:MAG: hypothetical protein SGJ24_14325 [Chloroflexota bacterium]|nr:hypothetical protein [Chloroflexota bacterium]